ncbi:MAG TPA: CoA-binding protein, partial [Patescibacteria group bacterium]|nr:CoA-binding protein [Patescibacteria group bacterium]
MDLNKLFNPSSIAIVGASEEEGKVGNVVTKNILSLGFRGDVFLVNPKHENLFARKCYKSLSEIQEPVDLAVIIIPAKLVASEIEKNAAKIKNYVIISAGFSEVGDEGREREEKIKEIAEKNQLNILGPNCLGFINPYKKLNATFAGDMPEEGNIALVSQSGALAVGILDIAQKENLKFSKVISIGNKADIDEAEIMEYLENDSNTRVIAMYLEGIKNGQRFLEKAADISRNKPIIILKAGKTEKAQKAISSHTGALAGSDDIASVIFEKAGITRADSTEEFFGLLQLFSFSQELKNEYIAVITNAGGPGVIATDAFKDKHIKIMEISEKTKEKLRKVLPSESSVENPVDVLGDAREDRYKNVMTILNKEEKPGAYLIILTPQDQTPVSKVASKIIQFKKKTDSIIAVSFIG